MRITVNLASRPFVELRPFFLRLRMIMGALAVVAIGVAIVTHSMQKKLERAEAQMDQLRAQTGVAQREKSGNERRMREPANAAVLERAHFLNSLFLRKSFSWTAVMMDLETVLPGGVQVTSIEPQISTEGDVVIRLRVSGDRDRAVQLVRNLERSKRFLVPRLTGEATQAKQANQGAGPGMVNQAAQGVPAGVEFEILANYNPLPEGQPFAKPIAHELSLDTTATPAAARRPRTLGQAAVPAGALPAGRYPRDGVVLKPYVANGRAR